MRGRLEVGRVDDLDVDKLGKVSRPAYLSIPATSVFVDVLDQFATSCYAHGSQRADRVRNGFCRSGLLFSSRNSVGTGTFSIFMVTPRLTHALAPLLAVVVVTSRFSSGTGRIIIGTSSRLNFDRFEAVSTV